MQTATQASPIPRKSLWAGRIISTLIVLFLLFDVVLKLVKPGFVVEANIRLGYSENLIVPIALVLLVCTVLYTIPRTSVLGAILLTGYLGGATATHVRVGDPFLFAVLFGVLVWGGLFLRDRGLRALIPLRH